MCPHMENKVVAHCLALGRIYVPTVFEVEDFCRKEDYVKCPLFRILANSAV